MEDVSVHISHFAHRSLSYLHTGSQLCGITHPILWKTSPSKNQFAIVSECKPHEQTLQECYLSNAISEYQPPSINDLCQVAIGIVEMLDELHSRKVRHGSLRPDVIGIWKLEMEQKICIRDFTESALLLDSDNSPPTATPTPQDQEVDLCSTACAWYVPPELLPGNTQPGNLACDIGSNA